MDERCSLVALDDEGSSLANTEEQVEGVLVVVEAEDRSAPRDGCSSHEATIVLEPLGLGSPAHVSARARRSRCLAARLAMLELSGASAEQSIARRQVPEAAKALSELTVYYEQCQRLLRLRVFKRLSLLNLLTDSEHKMRRSARHRGFAPAAQRICSDPTMITHFPYYRKQLAKRASKAARALELENKAMLAVCDLFNSNYNQLSIFTRELVGYLSVADLDRCARL